MNLHQLEDRFRESIEQAPVGILILRGQDMIVEMANAAHLQLVDRTKEQFIGRSIYESLPEVKETIQPLLSQVLATGIAYYGNEFPVTLHRHGQPEKTYFTFVFQPLRNSNGTTDGIIVVTNEVTTFVNARHVIQESEHHFRNLIMHSPTAMAILKGPDYIIDMANNTMMQKLWRRNPDDVFGKKILDVFPELIGQQFPALFDQVYQSGQIHQQKEALAWINGQDGMKKFYLDFEYAPLYDLEKKVYGLMITVNDVTERIENELALRLSEERFRVLADSLPQLIWTADAQGNLNYYSQSVYDYAGVTPDHKDHKDWLDMIHPSDREENLRHWTHAIQTGQPFNFEHRFRKHDGTYRWQLSRAVPQKDHEGNIQLWVATSTDIHDSKRFIDQLENQVQERTNALQHSNEELRKSNSELEQFAYIASHDLQEPLRKIQAFASRLLEMEYMALSPKGKDYFLRMQGAAHKMQQLIEDLLTYSRTSSNQNTQYQPTDLTHILLRVKEQLSHTIEQQQATIIHNPLPMLPLIPWQAEQLLANLLNNALKFFRPGFPPVIIIHADPQPHQQNDTTYHRITITDNGIGFEPQFNERIFQVFQRLHPKSSYEGTGIGLAICRKIMDNHKGTITASATPGSGAIFELLFPVT